MIGAGTIVNPILKLLTTAGILAAVYFFIVKPTLDTTEKISSGVSENIRQAQDASDRVFSDVQIDASRSRIASYIQSVSSTWPEAGRELRACAQKADRDPLALERCQRFAERVNGMQSERSFANSYADSLAAQGETAAAQRVRECVKQAGFEPGPMNRCRDLADRLLFG